MEAKRKELEEKRKPLLVETQGELEVTLEEEKMSPGELELA